MARSTAPTAATYRRRRRTALAVALLAVALAVAAWTLLTGATEEDPAGNAGAEKSRRTAAPSPPELPRGGRRILPDFRVVAFYGAPQDRQLGALGVGTPREAAARLARQAKPYARKTRPVLPALELIAVIANADPGEDGKYRTRQSNAVIRRYLRAARRAKALLLLDVQPGRSDFFTETVRLRRWLREPDVGLALDPEWRVQAGQVPGQVIGTVASREVNATSKWLERLVQRHQLPEKLFLIHQFTNDMVEHTELKPRNGLAMVLNVDGFGGRGIKVAKYRAFTREARAWHHGFKLFYEEDTGLMKPRSVLRLRPPPDVVVYE